MNKTALLDAASLPQWKHDNHTVHAARIIRIDRAGTGGTLKLQHGHTVWTVTMSDRWMEKFAPRTGGYYMVQDSGHVSFWPTAAFLNDYAPVGRIHEEA